ncbi:hypothetical protein [Gordonia crocea]|uniref:Lipoprotein n=1 Tax=Gordonia crocea TaxID=589162 RepID=A0A7I9UZE0_9ACTN|nr:hypothetical protein [Gordonia crocea]GED98485.1 hypothetical protein nbrc107697_25240 [Gordonia crocea]
MRARAAVVLAASTACARPAPDSVDLVVNTAGLRTEVAPGSMQNWAADVSRGDVATVVAKCWTVAPGYIRDRYFRDPTALAAIFAHRPTPAQAGVIWGDHTGPHGYVPWTEGRSDYPCPRVVLGAGERLYTDEYAGHLARRFILRSQGAPVNPGDTAAAYPMVCAFRPGPVTNVERADADRISVTREDLPHGDARWRARAGEVTVMLAIAPTDVCVQSAS